jgi:predicted protein tyrosine phosphatase
VVPSVLALAERRSRPPGPGAWSGCSAKFTMRWTVGPRTCSPSAWEATVAASVLDSGSRGMVVCARWPVPPRRPDAEKLRASQDEQNGRSASDARREVVEKVQLAPVCPVHVLEHEHRRLLQRRHSTSRRAAKKRCVRSRVGASTPRPRISER